jgi:hypothetical protein
MKELVLFTAFLFLFFNGQSQILIGGETSATDKNREAKKDKRKSDSSRLNMPDAGTAIYFSANRSKSFRYLESNGELYGDSLGLRANETSLNTWSYGVGIQNQLTKHVMWDGGISFVNNGESYLFTGKDTSYAYQTYYKYISMPLRLNYTYSLGSSLKLYVGGGLLPQLFSSYRQERQWTTSKNYKEEETIKTKTGYNTFAISALFNVGFMLNFENNWSLLVSPEARIQFNSSYTTQAEYVHKNRAYGVTFGLVRNL